MKATSRTLVSIFTGGVFMLLLAASGLPAYSEPYKNVAPDISLLERQVGATAEEAAPNWHKSDVAGVVFTPSMATLVKGGASLTVEAQFNGTVNAADAGHIIFNITEEDGAFDDLLIDVDIFCIPLLPTNTNFTAEVEFRVKCLAECELMGDDILSITITDPTTGNIICGGSPFTYMNHTADAERDHQVVIEDVPDGDNHGNLLVECREFVEIPTLTGVGLVAIGLALALAGLLVLRRRRGLSS
ncbi:MAG: hypothetical protein SX243_25180 [Acidobacteriota bacterium]|nr:hypothetical protein [Acidobacteriota bacterium]